MSMMLIALLVVLLPALQTEAAQTASTMQPDVDRFVRAAERLAGTWPSQPPPAIPEVAIVARHGKAVVPLLMALLRGSACRTGFGFGPDPIQWTVSLS